MIGDEYGLRDDHRRRREQQAELTERPGPRQQQVHDESDDDGRKAHQRVQRHEQYLPSREAANRKCGTERQADHGRDGDCGEAHLQAQENDFVELPVRRHDHSCGLGERRSYIAHPNPYC